MFRNTSIATSTLALLALLSFFVVDSAEAKDCGGENQSSCWSVDPNKWCNSGLQYVPGGLPGKGRCIKKPKPKPKPKKECGGLNQSSCWHVDPTKWCKGNLQYKPTGVPGKGTCVKATPKPAQQCGGKGQKSCWHVDSRKWCDAGLEYVGTGKPGDGRCITPGSDYDKSCGGINQSSCWNVDSKRWCDPGLEYVGTGKPGDGRCITPGSDYDTSCGGLNQASCWNVDPNRWCDAGLKYFGTGKPGQGTCIVPGSDPTPNCGGDGQSSCWNLNPKHWCDDGNSYSPGIVPNEGTCYRKYTDEEYKNAAQAMVNTVKRVGLENPITNLRTCLMKPENLEQLQQVMKERSENGFNRVLSICGAAPDDFIDYGRMILGYAPQTLEIGLSGGLVAGVGAEAAISYAIPLNSRPDGRYFITNGLGGGAGLAVGGDVTVGLSAEDVPRGHWTSDKGRSVNFSGKALGSVSVSIDFPERGITPNGFTVGGGVGLGAEIGTIIYTRDQYLYDF